jgi:PAS domain S-box-containing protein
MHEGGRIVFATGAMWRLLRRTPEEFQDGNYLELVHPDDLAEAQKVRGQPPPGVVWTATYRVRHADGHYVWFEIMTRGQYDADGNYVREISVGRDISERKEHELRMIEARERAEAANRAKSVFLANMSHELRTPLNAIIGFGDIMRQEMFGKLGDARYADYAEQVFGAGNRLLGIITDLLDMARIEAGLVELSVERVNAADLVDYAIGRVRGDAERKGVMVTAKVPMDAMLDADGRAVKQMLANLLSNAVKFTASGGRVDIEWREGEGAGELVVKDDGIGIPADAIPRLGRAFEQVSVDARTAKNGAGMGLALVRALAEKHGGAMHIASEIGVGTAVTICFPRKDSPRAAA